MRSLLFAAILFLLCVTIVGCGTKCVICGKRFHHKTHYVQLMPDPKGPMCDECGRKRASSESEKWFED